MPLRRSSDSTRAAPLRAASKRGSALASVAELERAPRRDSFTRRASVVHLMTKLGVLRQKGEEYEASGRAKARDQAGKMARAVERKLKRKEEEHKERRRQKKEAELETGLTGVVVDVQK